MSTFTKNAHTRESDPRWSAVVLLEKEVNA